MHNWKKSLKRHNPGYEDPGIVNVNFLNYFGVKSLTDTYIQNGLSSDSLSYAGLPTSALFIHKTVY